jgi:hypothetical protein
VTECWEGKLRVAHCPFCDDAPTAEAVACTNCGAQKTYDYFNQSVTWVLIWAAVAALMAALFVYVGYTQSDPKVLSGAKAIAGFFGGGAAAQLLLLYRGRIWRRTWFMRQAHRRATAAN